MTMILPVQITFRNMPHSDSIEAFVRKKAAQLDRYYDNIMACRVVVEVPHRHHRRGQHSHIRIDLTVPGGEIVIKHEPSLYSGQRQAETEECTKCSETATSHKHAKVAIREAFELARRRLQDYGRQQRAEVKTHEGLPRGHVCRLERDRGFGYIETPDGREVYFHRNSVLGRGFGRVSVGTEVIFVEEQGDNGPQASSVRLVGNHRKMEKISSA
ncbi:MAG: HPF/RaiA family ribosome-associated protein [Acidobacteriota bacterium]